MTEDPVCGAELTEIPASEILDKIQKGEPVVYDHVRVTGNLDVYKLDLPTKHVDRTEDLREIPGISEECKVVSISIKITNSTFNGRVNFSNNFFKDLINFENTTFSRHAHFRGATFSMDASFNRATFSEYAVFSRATFSRHAGFSRATFSGYAGFNRATFSGYAGFNRATFSGNAYFDGAKFVGDVLTFRNAVFNKPESQEEACRRAKNVLVKAGNRDEEEYHFYREMEAKRIQKGIRGNSGLGLGYWLKTGTWSFWKFFYYDVLEFFFVQKIFGYGVHPWWLIGWWGVIVTLFAIAYWAGNGIGGAVNALDYIKVSFATAIAPGYIAVIINPASAGYRLAPAYQAVAIAETIIGTFLWAGFIATFAKRYMR